MFYAKVTTHRHIIFIMYYNIMGFFWSGVMVSCIGSLRSWSWPAESCPHFYTPRNPQPREWDGSNKGWGTRWGPTSLVLTHEGQPSGYPGLSVMCHWHGNPRMLWLAREDPPGTSGLSACPQADPFPSKAPCWLHHLPVWTGSFSNEVQMTTVQRNAWQLPIWAKDPLSTFPLPGWCRPGQV